MVCGLETRCRSGGVPCLAIALHLVPDILLEAPHDQPVVAIILRRVVIGIADHGGVEESHERRKVPG